MQLKPAEKVKLDCALNTNAVKMNEKDLRRILPHIMGKIFISSYNPKLYSKIRRVPEHQYHKALENIKLAVKIKKIKFKGCSWLTARC